MPQTEIELSEEYLRPFTKDIINELPLRRFEGEVRVVRTEKQRVAALRELREETLLGFDTETRPVFKKGKRPGPPSLVQLAGEERVYLFQINVLPLDKSICEVLADPEIVKTGVAVRDDVLGLQRLSKFKPAGFLDLSTISSGAGMQTHGLRNLAANLLGFRISKSAQCSNWSKDVLTKQQVAYAATDAWVSREIYLAMAELGLIGGQ